MGKGAGTGLIAFGLILGAAGAILRFAVETDATGFNIQTAGVILLVVGILFVLAGVLAFAFSGRRRSTTHETVAHTAAGDERIQEREDWTG
jgi:hypothetical protein